MLLFAHAQGFGLYVLEPPSRRLQLPCVEFYASTPVRSRRLLFLSAQALSIASLLSFLDFRQFVTNQHLSMEGLEVFFLSRYLTRHEARERECMRQMARKSVLTTTEQILIAQTSFHTVFVLARDPDSSSLLVEMSPPTATSKLVVS